MSTELLQMIARTRRNMPRNQDVMQICNALEEKLKSEKKTLDKPVSDFDRQHYQRVYMRAYRARKKQKAAALSQGNEK
jgi:hypothetical protein